jgi:alanine racemase
MVMVKALAYGSGSIEVANLLQFHRVDYLGVAYTDEGITLRKNGISLPIMIMNPAIEALEKISDFRLEPEMYNMRILKETDLWTRNHGKSLKIHLKFDTGMHRLGFQITDLTEIIQILNSNGFLILTSVFSHLAAADESQYDAFTIEQAFQFEKIVSRLRNQINPEFPAHLANSAAIIRFPQYQYDMVRLGIGLYGTDASGIISGELKSIGTLKTSVSQIMKLKKSESVGYGRKGRLTKNSRIATIAIGYADGFSRSFSDGIGKVYVNGKFAPVIGNVCMDMTMVDVTGMNVKEGDEVIIFGKQLPLHHLADSINTIPYEILTGVSERVKRIYISE